MSRKLKDALSNLLAVLHGDGGHYESTHGTIKAVVDAQEMIHKKWITNEAKKDYQDYQREIFCLKEMMEIAEQIFDSSAPVNMITHHKCKSLLERYESVKSKL